MPVISRGFRGRRRDGPSDRVPPGQYLTDDFPVLSAGPTPHTPPDEWTFSIRGGAEPVSWTWEEFRALPTETVTVDIHCVTKWSKLDTVWEGVSIDTLLDGIETSAEYAVAFCDDGEVSPYLTDEARPGDEIEIRGPVGGYFVWDPNPGGSVLLVGGGSGVVPLMAMARQRAAAGDHVPTRLLYSARTWDDVIYRDELQQLDGNGFEVV